MTWTEITIAAKVDRTQASRKAKKIQEIREKYKAELAALRTNSFFPHLKLFFSSLLSKVPGLSKSQSPFRDTGLSSSIYVVSSDSDLEIEDISFNLTSKLPSSTLQQFGRT